MNYKIPNMPLIELLSNKNAMLQMQTEQIESVNR